MPSRDATAPQPCSAPADWPAGEPNDLPAVLRGLTGRGDTSVEVARITDDVFRLDVRGQDGEVAITVPLADGERIVGFGEQFVVVPQRGHVVDGWSEDLLLSDPRGTYFPAPLYHSSRGYCLIADTYARFTADVGVTEEDAIRFSVPVDDLRIWVVVGPPKAALGRLAELTGAPVVPPAWAFGVWSCTRSGTKAVFDECDRLAAEDVPVTAVWVDDTWFEEVNLGCGAPGTYPKGEYPDEAELVRGIHERGIRALGYLNCMVYQDTAWGQEAEERGYLVHHADGRPHSSRFAHPADQPGGGMLKFHDDVASLIDFANPDAVAWWQHKIRDICARGWDGWMEDFGESVPADAALGDGTSGVESHNRYPVIYHKATADVRSTEYPDRLFFVRAGYLGVHRYAPIVWGGDQSCDWSQTHGLASLIPAGISAGTVGVATWGPDISGIVELPSGGLDFRRDEDVARWLSLPESPDAGALDKELWRRWLEFGAVSPVMRVHLGFKQRAGTPVDMWTDDETLAAFRDAARLHLRLFPYLWALSHEAGRTGVPILRGLMLEFPEDAETWDLSDQYLLGDALLVAPVVEKGATGRSVYLPEGRWEHILTGERWEGSGRHDIVAPVGQPILLQRGGTVLPLLPEDEIVVGDVLTSERWARGEFGLEVRRSGVGSDIRRLPDGTEVRLTGDAVDVAGGRARDWTVTGS